MHLSSLLQRSALSTRLLILAISAFSIVAVACSSTESPTSTGVPATPMTTAVTSTATASGSVPTPPLATPVVSAPDDFEAGIIPVPPDRDLYELARRLRLKTAEPIPRFPSSPLPTLREGDRLNWKVNRQNGTVTVVAEVRHVSENAYWIFELGFGHDQGRIEQAAREFERDIWPNVIEQLGNVANPGVDNDPRIVIFHGELRPGVAGYFSGVDEYPIEVQADSNQRTSIYIAVNAVTLGGTGYLSTIAHELQHAVHWAGDAGEESWVNEGISEVASGLAGFQPTSPNAFLSRPNTSLVQWEPEIFQASPNYGAAALFIEYVAAHYGGIETLRAIINHPADGIPSIDAVLAEMGFSETAIDVFIDWTVANYVDDPSGIYSYPDRQLRNPRTTFIPMPEGLDTETVTDTVRPLGTNYYTIEDPEFGAAFTFEGQPTAQVFPAEPHSGETCWWTNVGDSINTTLTRPIDLIGVDSATFRFWVWHAIEEDWDYAYIEASTDGGVTWEVLETETTSSTNPNGTSYGPGLTGNSNGWIENNADLTGFTGSEILLRIEYITDDAIHDRGACFDDFSIPEIDWTDSTDTLNGWTSEGFALINDRLPVEYLVQAIRQKDGELTQVEPVVVESDGTGFLSIQNVDDDEEVTIAISVLTPDVTGSLEYTFELAQPRL